MLRFPTTRVRLPRAALRVAVLACGIVCAPRVARAADCDSSVATCIDSDILWPTAGPSTFFSITSATTTAKGRFGFALASSIQRNSVVLRTSENGPAGSVDVPAIGTQLNTSFAFAYGITDRLEASLVSPTTFYQNGTGVSRATGPTTEITTTAVRDVRLGLAYVLVPLPRVVRPQGIGVVARFDLSIPSGDRDLFAGDRGFVGVPTLACEQRAGSFLFSGQLGVRARKTTTLLGTNVGSQLYSALGLGLSIDREERFVATAEVFALHSLVNEGPSPVQWLAGLKWSPLWAGDFSIHGGGGGTARFVGTAPIGEATWRAVLDIRYAPLARDSDHDGVLDRDDQCPDTPEDRDGFEDTDGCPDPDNDKDGIVDALDRCKDEPEDIEGYEDTDGCPEPDRDGDHVKDAVDKCPDKPEDIEGYEDADGCPEGGPPQLPVSLCADGSSSKPGETCDVDHDGIADPMDACPTSAEDKDGIVDDDGCPERDADEDGIADELDKCPIEAETIDGKDDSDGCPEEGAHSLVTFEAGAIEVEKPVRFAALASTVTKPMNAQLSMVAQRLQGLADRGVDKIVIETWADTAGEGEANVALAKKRAEAIRAALVALGIPDGLIVAKPGDLADPPQKPRANWLVTVRTKRKTPLGKKPTP
jgi:outer membrane protein OmpA-like peptidoglycan-associated protein